ncbi:MAG: heme o synthase [Actinomycetota bacterium]
MRTRFQKLAVATAVVTVVLFAVGGLVRGTGSGLGCSTWPQCYPGQLFPSGTVHSLIEFSHRAFAFLVICLTLGLGILAWFDRRDEPPILWPSIASFPLVLGQAILGAQVVATELDPWWVTAHFVVALALIACVVYVAAASLTQPAAGIDRAVARGFARLTLWSAGVTGALLLVGTYIRAKGPEAGLAFQDWPLMDGRLVPTLGGVTTPMFLHRVLALAAFLLVLWVMVRSRTMTDRSPALVRLATLGLFFFVAQIAVGAANVFSRLKPWAVVLHVAFAVLIWATEVALATVAWGRARSGGSGHPDPVVDEAGEAVGTPSARDTITAYYRLTKPRIIVLLLITTVPAMMLAAGGMPPIWLILATLVGGSLAAGSANAVNMYLDRDIDELMKRTRQRPLPAHAITPEKAPRFGFVLGAISYLFLSITVNVLAATLALSAIAFYVFVYTMWLKRSTAQNIVIGGAAGAVPALVGWAAVTGTLAAPAWILFAIVFVWTPPHFWALAMRFSGDYAAAGVPMLPVVKGDDETRRQIFLYSLALFGTTLLLFPVASMGPIYLATAVGTGGVFVYRALVLWRRPSADGSWALFKYSIVYLAALFGAVALDALL